MQEHEAFPIGIREQHAELGSTMDRARELAAEAATRLPALVIADRQPAGRGRRGASWWQAPGSLALSLVVSPPQPTAGFVSLACGLAVAEAVVALEPTLSPTLRWPNDVEIAGRKLAGILVETAAHQRLIIGIGLNSAGSANDAPRPLRDRVATLPDLVGRALDANMVAQALLPRLLAVLHEMATHRAGLIHRYLRRCSLTNQPVVIHDAIVAGRPIPRLEQLSGIGRGIDEEGRLLLDVAEPAGPERLVVVSGSLTAPENVWRMPSGPP
jgi:BirA family biotin operon repressor/biotin-[acetyl-CoA-carboxylase] ligase